MAVAYFLPKVYIDRKVLLYKYGKEIAIRLILGISTLNGNFGNLWDHLKLYATIFVWIEITIFIYVYFENHLAQIFVDFSVVKGH